MLKPMYKEILKRREYWLDWERKRDLEFVMPESVVWHEDVKLGNGKYEKVDIYCPKQEDDKFSVIVNIHGGGFVMGTKHQNMEVCSYYASKGFLVFAIEYPLVPETTIFEQLKIISKTLNLINNQIDEYRGDRNNISLVGDSAGAFLAFYTAIIKNNINISKTFDVNPTELPIHSLGLSSALFYSIKVESNGLFLLRNDYFGKGWRNKEFTKYLNPENEEIIEALPRCFLSTSKGDFLNKHTLEFEKVLKANNKEYKLVYIDENVEHAFNALYPKMEASKTVNEQLVDYLKAN